MLIWISYLLLVLRYICVELLAVSQVWSDGTGRITRKCRFIPRVLSIVVAAGIVVNRRVRWRPVLAQDLLPTFKFVELVSLFDLLLFYDLLWRLFAVWTGPSRRLFLWLSRDPKLRLFLCLFNWAWHFGCSRYWRRVITELVLVANCPLAV